MKDWFIANYTEIKYWETIVVGILSIPVLICWSVILIHERKRKKKWRNKMGK